MKKLLTSVGSFMRTALGDDIVAAAPQSNDAAPAGPSAAANDQVEHSGAELVAGFSEALSFSDAGQVAGPGSANDAAAGYVLTRAQALVALCEMGARDPRTTAKIAEDAGLVKSRVYSVLHHGNLPTDDTLLKLCSAFDIPFELDVIWLNVNAAWYPNLPPLALRPTKDYSKRKKAGSITDRQEAIKLIYERLAADPDTIGTIARGASLRKASAYAFIARDVLPSDGVLLKLCKYYGIDLQIEPTLRVDPSNYEGFTPMSPRGQNIATRNAACGEPIVGDLPASAESTIPAVDVQADVAEADAPSQSPQLDAGPIDYDVIEQQIASLDGLISQARSSATAAAQLPNALALVGALEIDLAASRARETNLRLDLEKALSRAARAEGHLAEIQAILPAAR